MAKLTPEDIAFNNKIALRIKELRINSNISQSDFAKKNDIDRQQVNRWERINDKRGLSIHTIKKICKMLDISLSDFFDSDFFK